MKCPVCGSKTEKFIIDETLVKKLDKISTKNREVLLQMVLEAHQDLTLPRETSRLITEIKSLLKDEICDTRDDIIEKLDDLEKEVVIVRRQSAIKGQVLESQIRKVLSPVVDEIKNISQSGTRATDILTKTDGITILVESKSKNLPKNTTSEQYRDIVEKFTRALNERNTKWGLIVTETVNQLPSKEPVEIVTRGDKIIVFSCLESEYVTVAYRFLVEIAKVVSKKKDDIVIDKTALNEISEVIKDLLELHVESHWFVEKGVEIQDRGKSFEERFGKHLELARAKVKEIVEPKKKINKVKV